jgi:hypothetical protein
MSPRAWRAFDRVLLRRDLSHVARAYLVDEEGLVGNACALGWSPGGERERQVERQEATSRATNPLLRGTMGGLSGAVCPSGVEARLVGGAGAGSGTGTIPAERQSLGTSSASGKNPSPGSRRRQASGRRRTADYLLGGSDRAYSTARLTHQSSSRFVRTPSASTRSQPSMARPRISNG